VQLHKVILLYSYNYLCIEYFHHVMTKHNSTTHDSHLGVQVDWNL